MNNTQAYRNERVPLVTLNVLEAACEEARNQGIRYGIQGTSRTRCYVSCSLTMAAEFRYEDHSLTAVLPLFTEEAFGQKLTCVLLHVLRIQHDTFDGEGWQQFEELWDTARRTHRNPDGKLTSWQETNPAAEYEASSADLEKVLDWIQTGRKAALWRSAEIGNLRTWWTPGDRPDKQHWSMEDGPAAVFETEEEFRAAVNIITRNELAQ